MTWPYPGVVDFLMGLGALGMLAVSVVGTVSYLMLHPLHGRRRG